MRLMTTQHQAKTVHPLSYYRRWALLSQRDLGARCGITASTIYLIENGRTVPKLPTMAKICRALGVQWEDVAEFRATMGAQGVLPR